MTCSNSTAPVDINQNNVVAKCNLKCKYSFKYPNSSSTIKNKKKHLSMSYTNTSTPSAYFNSVPMEVSEIRIFQPSLHTYSGKQVDGEVVVVQGGDGDNLLTCIPIVVSNETSMGGRVLTTIINETLMNAPNDGESYNLNLQNFSLQWWVPDSPFFTYTGTLPYGSCDGEYSYVVYDPLRGGIPISSNTKQKLQKLIDKHDHTTHKNDIYYNKKGPAHANVSGKGKDQIYIECQETGEGSSVDSGSDNDDDDDSGGSIDWNKVFDNPIIIFFIALLGIFVLYSVIKLFMTKMFQGATPGGDLGDVNSVKIVEPN